MQLILPYRDCKIKDSRCQNFKLTVNVRCIQNKVCVGVCFLARQVIEKKRKEALTRKRELGIPVEDPSSGGFGSGGYLGSGGYSGSGGNLEY